MLNFWPFYFPSQEESNVDTSPVKKTKRKNRNKVLSDSDNEECDETDNCQETNGKKGELVQNSSLEDDNGEVGSVKEASSSGGEKKPPQRKTGMNFFIYCLVVLKDSLIIFTTIQFSHK